jgi:hypothetical protein
MLDNRAPDPPILIGRRDLTSPHLMGAELDDMREAAFAVARCVLA